MRVTRPYKDYFDTTIEVLSFASDGKLAAATTFYDALTLDISSGEDRIIGNSYLDTTAQPGFVDIDWSPDGTKLAVVAASNGPNIAETGTIKIWDVASNELITSWSGHEGADIWAIAWSSDGKFIVTAGGDQRVRIWNATTFDEQTICLDIRMS